MGHKAYVGAALALGMALSACGGDPKGAAINAEMMADRARIQSISNRLEPADREKFGQYLLNREMVSTGMVKALVTADGKDPATVGQAIELVEQWGRRAAERKALETERDAKIDVLRTKRERLSDIAEAAGWAPAQTQASNAVIAEIEAVQAEYEPRLAALN